MCVCVCGKCTVSRERCVPDSTVMSTAAISHQTTGNPKLYLVKHEHGVLKKEKSKALKILFLLFGFFFFFFYFNKAYCSCCFF